MKAEPSLCDYDLDLEVFGLKRLGLYFCLVCGKYLSRTAASAQNWGCCGRLVEPVMHEQEDYDA